MTEASGRNGRTLEVADILPRCPVRVADAPETFADVALLLAGTATLACYIPAQRAGTAKGFQCVDELANALGSRVRFSAEAIAVAERGCGRSRATCFALAAEGGRTTHRENRMACGARMERRKNHAGSHSRSARWKSLIACRKCAGSPTVFKSLRNCLKWMASNGVREEVPP